MKRKQLDQSNHPFYPQPFEAFWSGSWHPVEKLSINNGAMTTHVIHDGEVTEDNNVPMSNLRVRSREAVWSDCDSFLRSGIDVCVFSGCQTLEDERISKAVWLDARIQSIERKTQSDACTCRFYVSFYIPQGPDLYTENKELREETSIVGLPQICIIQNLEQNTSEGLYYRWSSTEDCFSVQQFGLLQGKFCADLTLLIAASFLKKAAFEVKAIQNRIVYQISGNNPSLHSHAYAVSFKLDNDVLKPIVVRFVPDNLPEGSDGEESGNLDFMELRRSKHRQMKSQLASDVKISRDEPEEDIDKIVSDYMNNVSNKKKGFDFNFRDMEEKRGSERKYARKRVFSRTGRMKESYSYVRESTYGGRSFRKRSASAQSCRELIRQRMINLNETLRNKPNDPPVVDHWKEFQTAAKQMEEEAKHEETPTAENAEEEDNVEEISETDMLWRDMLEIALPTWYLESPDHFQPDVDAEDSSQTSCKHECRLNEQVGMVCQYCGFVECEIRDMLPPFASSAKRTSNKEQTRELESEQKTSEYSNIDDQYHIPSPSSDLSVEAKQEANVWALIPDLGSFLRAHQRKAFEFLWRNIAGSVEPSRMEEMKDVRGGCVISHTPGAGKTLLLISFLVSYLKLFPGSRPLVLAPKTALHTWYKELIKWNISIPVYQIHGRQTYKGEFLKQRAMIYPELPKNKDVLHVLDCLDKMQNWLSHPSILLMGYTSFMAMTRENTNHAHRKYMAKILKQCPGILILDEGHNPRSTKSRLRKGLMKVDTRLRILLSGTLFQNNFGEYFNTLCLARPSFVNEVLKELDPMNNEKESPDENHGRKLFINKISRKIESNEEEERVEALQTLKKLTGGFIDVYEGGESGELPGLQCYTLMMKMTNLQREVMGKLQRRGDAHKGYTLELEFLVTLAAIHPHLITSTKCSSHYLTKEEIEDIKTSKFDVKSGSKVMFLMGLIPRCIIRKEKVLIFCHNIAPINFFVTVFEKNFGWRKGQEILVLQGDMEHYERGRVIDKFEERGGLSKVMLASITACAEGISLTAASRVVLIDSEWNPWKSKQAIARAFRPGQNKVVYVYRLVGAGTLEEEKHGRTTWKEWVSDMIFSEDMCRWEAPINEDELLREMVEEDRVEMFHRIMKNEKAKILIGDGKGD